MHACGHDLHTAMLVGAARLLAAERDRLHGDVVFMFQPGEEGHHGARLMIEEGVLDAAGRRPVAAYALHVASSMLPSGWLLTRKGPLLAGGDALRVTVRGRGGHDSQPHLLKDPVPAAAEMILALQTYASRGFDPLRPGAALGRQRPRGHVGQHHPGRSGVEDRRPDLGPGAKAPGGGRGAAGAGGCRRGPRGHGGRGARDGLPGHGRGRRRGGLRGRHGREGARTGPARLGAEHPQSVGGLLLRPGPGAGGDALPRRLPARP